MKLISLATVFVGVMALLNNIGVELSWSLVWPIALIFVGFAVKHCGHYYKCFGMGGKCGSGMCEGGKCKGSECGGCGSCKK
ncbi:MAG: hypothetical protein ACYCZ7_01630 [Minisyncoccota bacterium]